MADPVKEKKNAPAVEATAEIPESPQVPITPASSEAEIAGYNQFIKLKAARAGVPTAVLPGGVRVDATPFVRTRVNPRNVTKMLGDAASIVKDDFKREHPGWTFMWPIEKSMDTQAMIHSGRYKKVPYSDIDRSNPNAMVMQSPTGDTLWKQHILVAVSPAVYYDEVTSAEHESIGRTAMNRAAMENELTQAFGRSGYRGDVQITDVRQER